MVARTTSGHDNTAIGWRAGMLSDQEAREGQGFLPPPLFDESFNMDDIDVYCEGEFVGRENYSIRYGLFHVELERGEEGRTVRTVTIYRKTQDMVRREEVYTKTVLAIPSSTTDINMSMTPFADGMSLHTPIEPNISARAPRGSEETGQEFEL